MLLFAISSVFFFLLYSASTSNMLLLSHAAAATTDDGNDSGGGGGNDATGGGPALPPMSPSSNDQHTVHLMEVWTNNAADAYTIAPMLLRTGTYNNVLRVRWYWNKPCIGKHIILYVYTDDTKYFNESTTSTTTSSQRPELEWLEAALAPTWTKCSCCSSTATPHRTAHTPPTSTSTRRTSPTSTCAPSTRRAAAAAKLTTPTTPTTTNNNNSPSAPSRTCTVSNKYVVRNEDGTVNQQQSILALAQVNNVKCDILKVTCEKTHHWLACVTYNIFCKGKHKTRHLLYQTVVSRHHQSLSPRRAGSRRILQTEKPLLPAPPRLLAAQLPTAFSPTYYKRTLHH
eukprot:gene3842-4380_t